MFCEWCNIVCGAHIILGVPDRVTMYICVWSLQLIAVLLMEYSTNRFVESVRPIYRSTTHLMVSIVV